MLQIMVDMVPYVTCKSKCSTTYTGYRELGEERQRLSEARDAMLGPKDERTREQVRFERGEVSAVRKGARAYPLGQTVQPIRKVGAPVAAAKVYEGELTTNQVTQKSFLEVRQNVHLTSVDYF